MFKQVDERPATSIAIPETLVVFSIGAVGPIMLLGNVLYGPFISKSTMSFHLYAGVILALLSLILSIRAFSGARKGGQSRTGPVSVMVGLHVARMDRQPRQQ